MALAYIPSPSTGVLHLGPVPLRAYAFCIVGVIVATIVGQRRWTARVGKDGEIAEIAAVVVPAGIVGARIYHVITSPTQYLNDPVSALFIWRGGLGIWGVWPPASSPAGSPVAAAAWMSGCWPTPSRPRCRSRKESEGWATTSTLSSSDARPGCRGASPLTRETPTPSPAPSPTTPRSSTRCCGTSASSASSSGQNVAALGRGRAFALCVMA
jgi:hypothetical protein